MEYDWGGNRIQTSLRLTQEISENYTFVVIGFNIKIKEWWAEVIKRPGPIDKAQKHNGNYVKTNNIYIKKHNIKYGRHMPAVCG